MQKIKNVFKYSYLELLSDIEKPFIVGLLIAGIITFFFPDDLGIWSNNHPFLSMLAMLIAGAPMYVCATSSTPIAAALIIKGLNPGAALVFLLSGPATNAATMVIVKTLFNTRALAIYLFMIAVCSIIMGLILNLIYNISGIQASMSIGKTGEMIPYTIRLWAGVILAALMVHNMIRNGIIAKKYPEL